MPEFHPPATENAGDQVAPIDRVTGGEFTRATDLYGPARIREGKYFFDTGITPWSTFWYPISSDELFRGPTSPLAKYDQYVLKNKGVKARAAEYEEKHFYSPNAQWWAGRCDAWAIASLMEPEPALKRPVTVRGISFEISDLKALLVLSYEIVDGLVQFGQRNDGDYKSVPSDIYPDQFHRVLQKELFEKKRPFILDKEAGVEVWSTPIVRADVSVSRDPSRPNVMRVITNLTGALAFDPGSHPDPLETRPVTLEYTYDLYGNPKSDGSFEVVYGLWTQRSVREHPDFLWLLPDKKVRRSANIEVDPSIVDEIVQSARAAT